MSMVKNDKTNREIGRRLAEIRAKMKLTQEEMAKKLGISSQPVYGFYETGIRTIPTKMMITLVKMGFSLNFIMAGVGSMEIVPEKKTSEAAFNDIMESILDTVAIRSEKPDPEHLSKVAKEVYKQIIDLYEHESSMDRSIWLSQHRNLIRRIAKEWVNNNE